MPSGEHESPIELAKIEPGLMAWLADRYGVPIPEYHHVRPHATDVRVVAPATYHIDTLLVFCDADDTPRLATVWEPQRDDETSKLRAWKLYTVQIEKELDVACVLFAYCPDPKDAESYRRMIEEDRASSVALRPIFVTPDDIPMITDAARPAPTRRPRCSRPCATAGSPTWTRPSRHSGRRCGRSARPGRSLTMT